MGGQTVKRKSKAYFSLRAKSYKTDAKEVLRDASYQVLLTRKSRLNTTTKKTDQYLGT